MDYGMDYGYLALLYRAIIFTNLFLAIAALSCSGPHGCRGQRLSVYSKWFNWCILS